MGRAKESENALRESMDYLPTKDRSVRVIEGDCREILPKILRSDLRVVLITDPPYGIGLNHHSPKTNMGGGDRKRKRRTNIENDNSVEVADFIGNLADQYNIPLCMFSSPYRMLEGVWRNWLVWDKGDAVGGGGDPDTCWKRTFELIGIRNNRPIREGRDGAVLRYPIVSLRDFKYHPCQKPVKLMRYLIRQLSGDGDLIIDPCAGSGSTGIAALEEGRYCLLIESDPKYVEICLERIAAAGENRPTRDSLLRTHPLVPPRVEGTEYRRMRIGRK